MARPSVAVDRRETSAQTFIGPLIAACGKVDSRITGQSDLSWPWDRGARTRAPAKCVRSNVQCALGTALRGPGIPPSPLSAFVQWNRDAIWL